MDAKKGRAGGHWGRLRMSVKDDAPFPRHVTRFTLCSSGTSSYFLLDGKEKLENKKDKDGLQAADGLALIATPHTSATTFFFFLFLRGGEIRKYITGEIRRGDMEAVLFFLFTSTHMRINFF